MENHENIRVAAEAIENILAWIFADVDYPIEVLKGDDGDIQVNSSVFVEDGETVEITG